MGIVTEERQVSVTYWVADRGRRPTLRGMIHVVAAIMALVAGAVLTTFGWMTLGWLEALGVTTYAVGLLALFLVSALYHRGPWRHMRTVNWWRRADHATIAVFIASTYTPLCLIVLSPTAASWLLGTVWAGAVAAVVLNMVWINHPRWLAVLVYLVLGWAVVPALPAFFHQSVAVVVLLAVGGVVYSLGAIGYALRWPGREARYFGYHEFFHAATVVAAVVHHVAIWMVVVQA